MRASAASQILLLLLHAWGSRSLCSQYVCELASRQGLITLPFELVQVRKAHNGTRQNPGGFLTDVAGECLEVRPQALCTVLAPPLTEEAATSRLAAGPERWRPESLPRARAGRRQSV